MSEIRKALSVRAPWWWAIMHGKPIENRDWSTSFRGPVWIHASKFWGIAEIEDDLEEIHRMACQDRLALPPVDLDLMRESAGCIVGSVVITDSVTSHASSFFVGKFGFVLQNPVLLSEPVPCKGALGFFDIPAGLLGDAA